jgi:hypothetical protein
MAKSFFFKLTVCYLIPTMVIYFILSIIKHEHIWEKIENLTSGILKPVWNMKLTSGISLWIHVFALFVDDNECVMNVCGVNATCVNTLGSFVCSCPNGLSGPLCTVGKLCMPWPVHYIL